MLYGISANNNNKIMTSAVRINPLVEYIQLTFDNVYGHKVGNMFISAVAATFFYADLFKYKTHDFHKIIFAVRLLTDILPIGFLCALCMIFATTFVYVNNFIFARTHIPNWRVFSNEYIYNKYIQFLHCVVIIRMYVLFCNKTFARCHVSKCLMCIHNEYAFSLSIFHYPSVCWCCFHTSWNTSLSLSVSLSTKSVDSFGSLHMIMRAQRGHNHNMLNQNIRAHFLGPFFIFMDGLPLAIAHVSVSSFD